MYTEKLFTFPAYLLSMYNPFFTKSSTILARFPIFALLSSKFDPYSSNIHEVLPESIF